MTETALAFLTAASPLQWLLAFVVLTVLDIAWARYTNAATGSSGHTAGKWAVGLYLLGGVATIAYTSAPVLLIPACAGAYLGTRIGVWWSRRRPAAAGENPYRAAAETAHAGDCGVCKPGWYCSREAGHDGPHAAWPISHETAESPFSGDRP